MNLEINQEKYLIVVKIFTKNRNYFNVREDLTFDKT